MLLDLSVIPYRSVRFDTGSNQMVRYPLDPGHTDVTGWLAHVMDVVDGGTGVVAVAVKVIGLPAS
jgi:hypothetical protein